MTLQDIQDRLATLSTEHVRNGATSESAEAIKALANDARKAGFPAWATKLDNLASLIMRNVKVPA